ncbi:DNA-deoxyinosine glycosylase [Metasolibacillus meyeri]|uniref:DNA-deoxyinosine glycosylase n=1 Tax=Metasolibacillus meyeri TaxID=1071052 RepID=A0AAW9NPJ9_9BACL|nr:DNA-deoxyinosine glycosylase [Metasolibacillus meyeri]MEC1177935.1 DNA-deoxyinosine glycosylase [Metasolibacillus meyeri]
MRQNSLPPIIDENTQVLILGSMPSVQSLEKQQYYGNTRNHFWPIIAAITEESIQENYRQRIEVLKKKGIGLWDSIQSCERQGSLDANIRNEVANDFSWLFQQYPQVKAVLFNGAKSFEVFKKHIGLDILDGRYYEKMPSTSPIPGKNIKTFEQKIQAWSTLKQYIV